MTVICIGCSQDTRVQSVEWDVRPSCDLGANQDPYFGRSFGQDRRDRALHFGILLFAMQEPSLSCGPGHEQSYRVLYYASLAPEVVAVRLSYGATGSEMVWLTLSRRTDGSWPVTRRARRELTESEWTTLAGALDPTLWSVSPPNKTLVLDGATWLFEGRSGARYHSVLRGSGNIEDSYRDLARALFQLAGAPLPDDL